MRGDEIGTLNMFWIFTCSGGIGERVFNLRLVMWIIIAACAGEVVFSSDECFRPELKYLTRIIYTNYV